LERDRELDGVRSRADYQKLVAELKKDPDYQENG
jgi:hypothetical protein